MGGRALVFPYLLLILIIIIPGLVHPSSASNEESITLRGIVTDFENRQLIENANITVWKNFLLLSQEYTNTLGLFTVQVPRGGDYKVYICADDPNTTGWDYLPALKEISSPTGDVDLTVELWPAASVIVDNDIQFVDMTTPTRTYTYEVRNLTSEETINVEGYKPIYGTPIECHTGFLNLNTSHLIVPAKVTFDIRVNASVVVRERAITRSFIIDELDHLKLSKGDLIHLDVKKYSLQYNLGLVEDKICEVEKKIGEMDRLGFYLSLEKQRFVAVSGIVDSAKFDLLRGVDSFKELRRAYIDITDLNSSLIGMYGSAATSVYVLIFFLAFTSTTISFLFFEKSRYKLVASVGLTVLMHLMLHEIYPGADYISTVTFLEFSAVAWFAALLTVIVLPHYMKGRAFDGRTPLWNIIVPIFSLAKRSLIRRRLRFILTLSSVTILVMSFVTLTSFTMGYGLVVHRISDQRIPVNGVLIRAPSSEIEASQSSFTPLDATAFEWIQKQSEVEIAAPKAENQPFSIPHWTLNGKPIYGVVGILPSAESKILSLDELIVEGRYLTDGEENAILISSDLKEKLGIEVNATLHFGEIRVRAIGIYEGEKLRWLRDLDGGSIIPNKLVNISPPGEPPAYQAFPVEMDEFLICGFETALRISGVFVSRINVKLREGKSVNDFAERLALERNYDSWSSSSEGLYIARLGTYFQGKGFPLIVPWAIVVLNAVITMLNALYERRREIGILSSLGLNPSHIAGIFIAETVAIGLIGGGVGYLLGLGMYKAMTLLQITLEVRQKVSALWCLAALGIAMTALIIGALSALKSSVIITPSLMRRWRIEEKEEFGKPLEIVLPISVPNEEIDDFMDYVLRALRGYENDPVSRTERVRVWSEDTEETSKRGIRFIYRTIGGTSGNYSNNKLVAERRTEKKVYTVRLLSMGEKKWIHQTGSLVRMIIMRWSIRR